MWDERYSVAEYVYGTQANDFLVSVWPRLPAGKVLCLAEGEGRNAVFLAEKGFEVVAVDSSAVGLAKLARLAQTRGVKVETVCADLADFEMAREAWSAVVSIFAHLPRAVRAPLHRRVVAGLQPGGVFVLEAYTPAQLQFKTGGPSSLELLMDLPTLLEELRGLDFLIAREVEREVQEGLLHRGRSAVVQILAGKP
ncbi:MAG: class I SAM-dependent methyltransferase [candidate division KSB1 bacterium]|nr:class I SAM-dependent methyltransferase [candidate division KSB1 bacterium]MDZ7274765.1 class I SAM-dependent methyltransferase [candidate division KSB1 bacterium]MDZ7285589.1 class I SAM-dependent methyltransferase [candidate division KSB1 bacterium]MDZ7298621.1 class I SAM-dependent methyltransferase [candidate division KSB1 bacterium]MDZ7307631.1 class I SAM-dependent methyltransferase [candidate division KSB1 bacterium]